MQKPRINNEITAPKLRVIGANKENLGVMSRDEALAHVGPGIDLIEVVPDADPPVARLMSFDKYRYEREKAVKKERREQKAAGIKQIQISARAAENDLRIKVKQLEEFLAENHPVEVQMRLRGREKYMKDWAKGRMQGFLGMISVEHRVLAEPKFAGRGMIANVVKK